MTGLATRIALLLPDLTGGGVERTAVSLAQGLLDRGIEVDHVLCRVRGPLLAELPGAVRVVPLKRSPMILGRLLMAYTDPGGIPELARTVLFTWRPPGSMPTPCAPQWSASGGVSGTHARCPRANQDQYGMISR